MKKTKLITVVSLFLLVPALCCLLIWCLFRNPCQVKYYTDEMKTKYNSVEAVLESMYSGEPELVNEACGYERNRGNFPALSLDESELEIGYYPSKKMAFYQGQFFLWRKGRWTFYPETPWLVLIETKHGSKSSIPE